MLDLNFHNKKVNKTLKIYKQKIQILPGESCGNYGVIVSEIDLTDGNTCWENE